MNKQLTQEQIDSLNAVYAKMEDDSLELEFLAHSEWLTSNDQGNDIKSRVQNIMICNTPYRIKPEAPKTKYWEIKGAELPVPRLIELDKPAGYGCNVRYLVSCKSPEDAEAWYFFFRSFSDNIITK